MEYRRPQTIKEAIQIFEPGAYFLAGGTDLTLQIRQGKVEPRVLVDLGGIAELKQIEEKDGNLRIGSMASFSELESNELVRTKASALYQSCLSMGSPQIRNQATIGGNLANCSPAADSLPALLVLNSTVTLGANQGEWEVSLAELLTQEQEPLLPEGTLIKFFSIPLKNLKSGFAKLGRRQALSIARINAAIAVESRNGRAGNVLVALGAVGKRAFVCEQLSRLLSNRKMDEAWLKLAQGGGQEVVKDSLGNRSSAPYKGIAVAGAIRSAILALS